MKKYEELEKNLYVKEVGNLNTLYEASKMLGVSNKELRKSVITEQMNGNKIIKELLDKLFGVNIIPEIQQSYYLDMLESKSNLAYVVSVLEYSFPNLKKNPQLFLQAILEYSNEQIKGFDKIEIDENEKTPNASLINYVSCFASDYGISTKKMYKFITGAKEKNESIFNKMLGVYKKANYGEKGKEEKIYKNLKKISNLDYVVASIIYNFPNLVSNTDMFFSAILEYKEKEVEKVDFSAIEDENIKSFIETKQNYYIPEKVR